MTGTDDVKHAEFEVAEAEVELRAAEVSPGRFDDHPSGGGD